MVKNLSTRLMLHASIASCLLVIFCFAGSMSYAQSHQSSSSSDAGERLRAYVKNMDAFNRLFPQEKVYLHFDNTGYYRGETIWFCAYVLRSDKMLYTDMSSVLYVELLSPSGDVIETQKLKIEDGRADGLIKLDNLFTSGFYEIRAYTRYMLNWDSRGIFSRVFPIYDAPTMDEDNNEAVISEVVSNRQSFVKQEGSDDKNASMNVRFFPEGGRLVKGLPSKVAFEVDAHNAMITDTILGKLILSDGTVHNVRTQHNGRGLFEYTPADTPAELVLTNIDGKEARYVLPDAENTGVVMCVDAVAGDTIKVNLCRTTDFTDVLGLLLVNNGNVIAFEEITLNDDTTRYFNRSMLPDGVSQLALITFSGDIVVERMLFVAPQNQIDTIAVDVRNRSLMPCAKVDMTVRTLPNTTFSMSVRDYEGELTDSHQNAATWLLLSSDLNGYIHNPEYYLESDDEEHRKAADLLMMVQGWSRYDLNQMMGNKAFIKKHYIEDKLYVTGKVKSRKNGKNGIANVALRATLFNESGYSLSGHCNTDSLGSFAFHIPDAEGEWTMIMDVEKQGKSVNSIITIDRNFSPPCRDISYPEMEPLSLEPFKINSIQSKNYSRKSKGGIDTNNLLEEIDVKGRRRYKSATEAWERESRGAYKAYLRYDCDMAVEEIIDMGVTKQPFIYEWLVGKNRNFTGSERTRDGFRGDSDDLDTEINHLLSYNYKKWITVDGLSYKNRPIIWILNNEYYGISGAPSILDKDIDLFIVDTLGRNDLMPVSLDECKVIYISEDDYAWRPYFVNQDIAPYHPVTVFVYSRHTANVRYKGIRKTYFEAYSKKETYEMPDYSVLPPMADHRRTLYWNPNVKTDKDGKAEIEFYNNSSCRQIVVSAEGITGDGRAVVFK